MNSEYVREATDKLNDKIEKDRQKKDIEEQSYNFDEMTDEELELQLELLQRQQRKRKQKDFEM